MALKMIKNYSIIKDYILYIFFCIHSIYGSKIVVLKIGISVVYFRDGHSFDNFNR